MRHFAHLSDGDVRSLFALAPESFDLDDGPDVIGIGLGATLYCPATRPTLARDIVRRAAEGVTSMVVCLEDAVADEDLAAAEANLVRQLRLLHDSGRPLPMLFVRVRRDDQIRTIVRALGPAADVLTGIVIPKFDEDQGAAFLDAAVATATETGRPLLAMPVIEAAAIAHLETRVDSLLGARRMIDKYRDVVPAVRIGATDLSAVWGLRRSRDLTVWDVRVVADVIAAVVNVVGRVDGSGFVISGPVREYFATRPGADATLLREVSLDRANGLLGKTVIHPSQVPAVHASSVVPAEEYADARAVLATGGGGGATASVFGDKMNESKPHTAWATRTLLRARIFGVAREGTTTAELLAASRRP